MREDAPEYFDSDVVKLLHANHAGRSIIEGADETKHNPSRKRKRTASASSFPTGM